MLTQSKQTPKTGVACRVPGRAASKTASRMFKKGRKPSLSSAQNCMGGQSALLVGLGQPTLRTTSSRCSRLLQPPPQPPRAPRQAKERSQNIRSMPKAPSIQSTQGADRAKTKLKVKATHALQILMRYQRNRLNRGVSWQQEKAAVTVSLWCIQTWSHLANWPWTWTANRKRLLTSCRKKTRCKMPALNQRPLALLKLQGNRQALPEIRTCIMYKVRQVAADPSSR
mmetsp:Transcript_68013/g.149300  ORF Transcript_68013/g.149300 Transcript_68013/m.149300 type:complete len:226 (-) Transcript_68013:229-906(-)